MLSSPRKPVSTMRIFSSAENCRRVARRISFTTCSAGSFTGPDFCPICAPSMATMGQKSSLTQLTRSVSVVLMPDIAYDQGARKQGFAWDEPTQERANEAARRDCGSEACKVRFGVPPGKCAALARPESGPAWGGAVRKSVDEAKSAAVKNCQKHAKDNKCTVQESKCTKQ